MNAILQTQLDRVETALNTLIDSITSYNPSIPAAIDLLSADNELTKGLDQLSTHQTNHARILALRATAAALDSRLTSILALLASTRAELLATPATVFPPSQRDVPYEDLLAYAKHISKFTVPPTRALQQQQPPGIKPEAPQSPQARDTNGADTPSAGAVAAVEASDSGAGLAVEALQPGEVNWLDPGTQMAFVPWPSEEVIRRGALAQIQVMLEQGVDPESVAAESRQEKEEEEEEEEEGEPVQMVKVENGEGMSEGVKKAAAVGDRDVKMGNDAAVPPRERREEKPRVFGGLDLYDPDAE